MNNLNEYTVEEFNSAIDEAIEVNGYVWNQYLVDWMIANGHRKEDKPFGRAYRWTDGAVFYFTTNDTAFGFNYRGEWVSLRKTFDLSLDEWRPYPQEKWEAMLLEYAKSRGYKNGNYKCLYLPNSTYDFTGEIVFLSDPWGMWIDAGEGRNLIFDSDTGIWAGIIPEYTMEQLYEKVGEKFTIKN